MEGNESRRVRRTIGTRASKELAERLNKASTDELFQVWTPEALMNNVRLLSSSVIEERRERLIRSLLYWPIWKMM